MFKKRKTINLILFGLFLFLIILDSRTAVNAAKGSIDMCIKTVVPSVFPFLFLGGAIAAEIAGTHISILERILHIPRGTAGYFLIGQLCGYPVGAKLLQNAVERNEIDQSAATRMVSFCNNASPAFIIGIMTPFFSNIWIPIILWLIQIVSSLLLGMLLPKGPEKEISEAKRQKQNLTKIMADSIMGTVTICGWIVLLGIVLAYMSEPILKKLSPLGNVILSGSIELTSGLFRMYHIRSESIRFTISSVLLSLGGICVLLQTKSVAPSVSVREYLFARFIHAIISSTAATITSLFLFSHDKVHLRCIPLLLCAGLICYTILFFNKKMVAFDKKL